MGFIEHVAQINDIVNGWVWGVPMLVLILGTGIYVTCRTGFFQITKIRYWLDETFLAIFKKRHVTKHTEKHEKSISQFQALCTALAATIGVGNIAGVAGAIITGGPGAVFWMWISAFFGMMTNYSENVLGIYYRRKNKKGEWSGGAMYYLQDGLGSKKGFKTIGKVLAVVFSLFCISASFGIGNMTQVHEIASSLYDTFQVPLLISGILIAVLVGLVVVGGIKAIGRVTEKIVPAMALLYIFGTVVVLVINYRQIPAVFSAIFSFAFGLRSIAGAAVGIAIKTAVTMGFKRGVFSNEAGLGSSVMVHSASNVKEPVIQGMWGIFEVFFDTIIVCTLTAFTILSSGLIDLQTGVSVTNVTGASLVSQAFSVIFGHYAGWFIAVAIVLFAFSTVLGWSFYGAKSWEYLFGTKAVIIYKCVFVLCIVFGATMSFQLAWDIADTLNGLMAIPNLIGVLTLSGTVFAITRNYVARKIKKDQPALKPMLSFDKEIQQMQEAGLGE